MNIHETQQFQTQLSNKINELQESPESAYTMGMIAGMELCLSMLNAHLNGKLEEMEQHYAAWCEQQQGSDDDDDLPY